MIHCEPWNPPEIVVSFKKEGERVARGYFHETPDDGALGALDDMKIVAPVDLKRLFVLFPRYCHLKMPEGPMHILGSLKLKISYTHSNGAQLLLCTIEP